MTDIPDNNLPVPGLRDDGLPDIAWCTEIPPGDYPLSSEKSSLLTGLPQEIFTLKHPFRLAQYPITQAQFHVFMQDKQVHKETPDHIVPLKHPERARGGIWWSDTFVFVRWLDRKYHEAGLLAADWQIDVPSEVEWELAARYPDNKFWRPTKEWVNVSTNGMCEVNVDTGMHITLGFFHEWCLQRHWHSREGLATEVDTILQDHWSHAAHIMNYLVLRGVIATLRRPLAPTWDYGIGMRVVCRPTEYG